jgi:hypothetical protein
MGAARSGAGAMASSGGAARSYQRLNPMRFEQRPISSVGLMGSLHSLAAVMASSLRASENATLTHHFAV